MLYKTARTLRIRMTSVLWLIVMVGMGGCAANTEHTDAKFYYYDDPLQVTIPAGVSAVDIENAMLLAAVKLNWRVISQSPNQVVAKHQDRNVSLLMRAQGRRITIANAASKVVGNRYVTDPQFIFPYRWLAQMQQALRATLLIVSP